MWEYRCYKVEVVDGDTLHVVVDQGLETTRALTVRLVGINAPEKNTPEGVAAKEFTDTWINDHEILWGFDQRLSNYWPLIIHTVKDKREKYGRYLADIIAGDGASLAADLVVAGHAVPYSGGKR